MGVIIDFPKTPAPAKIEWKPRQPTQVSRGEFTGTARSTILAMAPYWSATVEYPTIIGEARFRPWRSALMRLQGRANAFRLSACEGPQHRMHQSVVVDGPGQTGYVLETRGWLPGQYLLDGMFINIGEALHQVVADTAIAGADGKVTIAVMPHIPNATPDGMAVETLRPWGLMKMATDDQGWTVSPGQEYTISYSCQGA